MAQPSSSDLIYYVNKPLTDKDWETNFNKIIEWLTSGTYDIVFGDVEISGGLAITGDVVVDGTVTSTGGFAGDGSALSGLNLNYKNRVYNGIAQARSVLTTDYTFVNGIYSCIVDFWAGMAEGTSVDAGEGVQTDQSPMGRTGWGLKFEGMTLTGSGKVHLRTRLPSKDALKLKGQQVTFSVWVRHDAGTNVNYLIYVRKADEVNDFSTTTLIDSMTPTAVPSGTNTQLVFTVDDLGACGGGLEVEIEVQCGAITNKNFWFTEMQLEINATNTDYEYLEYAVDALRCGILAGSPLIEYGQAPRGMEIQDLTGGSNWLMSLTAGATGIQINDSGTGNAIRINKSAGYTYEVVLIQEMDTDFAGDLMHLKMQRAGSSGNGLQVDQAGTGDGIDINNTGSGYGLRIDNSGAGNTMLINNTGGGYDIYSNNWSMNNDGETDAKLLDSVGNSYSADDLIAISLIF